ncbi:serine protease FAM111A-like [Acipenser ruthenus]|uniref:serine protease FAM111A-like n=1 Tax=Acipenser ruthenus TaxID=7906 RepID=UPI0027412462|nr:serine protease FAM111A-like [Acipenser ruthenus]
MARKKQTSISSFLKKRPKCSGAEVSRSPAERLDSTEQRATASPAPDIKPETEETPLCTDDGESSPSKLTRSQTKGSFTIRLPDNSLSEESFYDDETLSDVLNKNLTLEKLKRNKKKNQLLITGQRFLTGIVPLHLPCSFITNQECFKTEFIAGEEGSSRGRDPNTPQRAKHIVFYIEPKGRGNRKIVKNNHVNQQGGKLCVYAFKGETVLQALHRDGRFEDVVFKKRCQLSEVDTNRNVEMHVSVDSLDKRKFTLIVSNEDAPASQQVLCNTGLSNKATADHQAPSIATGEPQSTSTTAGDSQPPSSGNGDSQPARTARGTGKVYRLPDTEEVCRILRSQMDDLIKLMKERKKETKDNRPIRELLRQEFGKNTEIFTEIHTIRRQTELSESVCFITVPARDGTVDQGTGFRFIGNCILTCAHVLDKCMINSQYEPELITKVFVTFKYEKLIKKAECEVFYVKQLVAHDRSIDYALLELDLSQEHPPLPPALIDILAVPQTSGGICIIGHPEGRVKLIDLCSIIKAENCKAKAQEHIACHSKTLDKIENERFYQALSVYSFEMLQDRRRLFYDTCFYHGSSGSPVFNAQHQLVAMQQGGYAYKLDSGKTESVIEYGIHMTAILQSMLQHEIAAPLLQEMCRISLEKQLFRSVLKPLVEYACRHSRIRTILKDCLQSFPQCYTLLESLSNKSSKLGTLLIECKKNAEKQTDLPRV